MINWDLGKEVVQLEASLIVNGLNPPAYHDWDRLIPEITTQVLAAGRASGATLLVPGNVYPYGMEPGPWNALTPHRRSTAIRNAETVTNEGTSADRG